MIDPVIMNRLKAKTVAAGAVPAAASNAALGSQAWEFTIGPERYVLRALPDGPGYERVHLRSVTPHGEISLTSQRPAKAGALVRYVEGLVAAQRRKETS